MSISSKVKEQVKFLYDFSILLEYIKNYKGVVATIGEGWRTQYQQEEYYRKGLTKTLNSLHKERLAIDLNFYDYNTGKYFDNNIESKKILQEIGDFWESLDPKNKWGGNYKSFLDIPHFERRTNV